MFQCLTRWVAVFVLSMLVFQMSPGATRADDHTFSPQDIEKLYAAAMASKDASKVAGYYEEDAKLYLPDGSVVSGREAIQKDLEKGYESSDRSLQSSHIAVTGDDTHVTLIWDWTLRIVERGRTSIETGRSLHVWVKGEDGWRIRHDMYQAF